MLCTDAPGFHQGPKDINSTKLAPVGLITHCRNTDGMESWGDKTTRRNNCRIDVINGSTCEQGWETRGWKMQRKDEYLMVFSFFMLYFFLDSFNLFFFLKWVLKSSSQKTDLMKELSFSQLFPRILG